MPIIYWVRDKARACRACQSSGWVWPGTLASSVIKAACTGWHLAARRRSAAPARPSPDTRLAPCPGTGRLLAQPQQLLLAARPVAAQGLFAGIRLPRGRPAHSSKAVLSLARRTRTSLAPAPLQDVHVGGGRVRCCAGRAGTATRRWPSASCWVSPPPAAQTASSRPRRCPPHPPKAGLAL